MANGTIIKLSEVKSSDVNPESRMETYSTQKFQQMVEDYKAEKSLPAIAIREHNGSYKCLYGSVRMAAMIKAGITEVKLPSPLIVLEDGMADKDADLMTILENHNRQDLKWWEQGQQWRKYSKLHGITQTELAAKLPNVALKVLQRIEAASKMADGPGMADIMKRLDMGYNTAQKVKRIQGGMPNWKLFMEAMNEMKVKKDKDIEAYVELLKQIKGEPLTKLLIRIREEKLSVDKVKASMDRQIDARSGSTQTGSTQTGSTQTGSVTGNTEVSKTEVSNTKPDKTEVSNTKISKTEAGKPMTQDAVQQAKKYMGMLDEMIRNYPGLLMQLSKEPKYAYMAEQLRNSIIRLNQLAIQKMAAETGSDRNPLAA